MASIKELLGDSYKDGMTFDEIEKALSSKNLADLSTGDYVSKSKYTDFEKKYKDIEKKYNDKLTDEEKQAAERAEIEKHYKELEKQVALNKYEKKLGKTITDEKVLSEVVSLFAEGKMDEAFDKQNEYLANERERIVKETKDELMKKNPAPGNSGGAGGEPKKFADMDLDERCKLKYDNPTEYEKLKQEYDNSNANE